MRRFRIRGRRAVIAIAFAAAAALTVGGASYAAVSLTSSASPVPRPLYACEDSGHVVVQLLSSPSSRCPAGTTSIVVGAQGPSGVVSTKVDDLGSIASVPTGGSFVTRATQVGSTVSLAAGTYLISLNAKATPNVATTAEIFPQFFIYNQPANTNFTGDLFNVGAGALEPFNVDVAHSHDSYFSGSDEITLTAATTLHIYAFGYDSDNSAGTYKLDDLTVTAVKVTPAS